MAFLLGTFLTGGVLGFSANQYMKRDQVCTTRGVHPLVETMARRLALSPEQSARMDSILDNRAAQYRKASEPVRAQFDSIKHAAREQMRRVLTREQQLEFEALLAEMRDSTRKDNDDE
jgi:Spy/CpxP family protein refolding chaperone